ncbi:MAG: acyltransferase domain-containing protein, partial [Deltaproteobacteria bacterium]|nr:acyltransferase domain-containing protein [Deltaproteobacteria bacterium]
MNKSLNHYSQEPVAIIGIGCRFPGDANSPETFWQLLKDGVDTITEVPVDRFDIDAFYDPDPEKPGKIITRYGGFLKEIDKFDSSFFGISPREAEHIDPQQRLLLEVAWEAIEDGGQPLETFYREQVGVFIGIYSSDYENRMFADNNLIDFYSATGAGHYSAAGRLSHVLNLRGPSMAIETACSSSLVSIHLACRSLRNRESDLALAGGVNLILNPQLSIAYSKGGVLSPEGRCKFGDAHANGFVRGEGCGIIVLKPLSNAMEDGDRIYALILGSAINNDGREGSLVTPSIEGQTSVQRKAYFDAGVHPRRVHYIEAHGTGTAVGDPIEMKALGKVLGEQRASNNPCLVGSVKTNIGHLETASGIAGLIKAALCLHHRQIPPSLHFDEPNPKIPWNELKIKIQKELIPLSTGSEPALIGVNSFGLAGMNAHIVLQEILPVPEVVKGIKFNCNESDRLFLLPLSARSNESLSAMVKLWLKFLSREDNHTDSLFDICYTASLRRTHHYHRLAFVGKNKKEIIDQLSETNPVRASLAAMPEQKSEARKSGLVFAFSGQGPQWYAMGRQLLEQEPVYRQMVERISNLLQGYTNWSLIDELRAEASFSRMDRTDVAQPALFALQMGLTALWRSWGIVPDAVVGHSIGEVAAACFGEVLTIEDAVKVVYHRGRLLQLSSGQGKMAAVEIPLAQAESLISDYAGRLTIAAINSPTSVTLSGEAESLQEVLAALSDRDIFCHLLKVNYAFHSPQIDPYQEEMRASVAGIRPKPARIPIMSTVTGKAAVEGDYGAAYWAENIRRPVQFASATQALIGEGMGTFLEIGPHPVLGVSITQCIEIEEREGRVLTSLRRGLADRKSLLTALGALYVEGRPVKWEEVYAQTGRCVHLPNYPWQKKRHWIQDVEEGIHGKSFRSRRMTTGAKAPSLLGTKISSPLPTFESEFSLDSIPFIADHRIEGAVIVPGAVYLSMALAAAEVTLGEGVYHIEDVNFHEAFLMSQDGNYSVQTILTATTDTAHHFRIYSIRNNGNAGEEDWKLHASGNVLYGSAIALKETPQADSSAIEQVKARLGNKLTANQFYENFSRRGLDFGPAIQGVQEIWLKDGEAIGKIGLPEPVQTKKAVYQLDPALLDACFQTLIGLLPQEGGLEGTILMSGLDRFSFLKRPGNSLWCHASLKEDPESKSNAWEGQVKILNDAGELVGEAQGLLLKRVVGDLWRKDGKNLYNDWLYKAAWFEKNNQNYLQDRTAQDFPSSSSIARVLKPRLDELGEQHGQHRFQRLYPQLEELSVSYVIQALGQIGFDFTSEEGLTFDKLTDELGVAETQFRFFGRILEMLTEDGYLRKDASEWMANGQPPEQNPEDRFGQLLNQFPECEAELTLTARCGAHLGQVLKGACDPLPLLFPQDNSVSAESLYHDSVFARAGNSLIQETISAVVQPVASAKKIRILEIGAGTGGATSYVLPMLPADQTEYVFSDISAFFTTTAQQKFKDYPFVRYQLLNIEEDPLKQGFEGRQFDIVIASNVIHATKELRQSLEHVNRLLAPGGFLIMLEVTARQRWIDIIFGMTEGWWRFTDKDLRAAHPLLNATGWISLLQERGYDEVITIPGAGEEYASNLTAILARASLSTSNQDDQMVTLTDEQPPWIVFADQKGLGNKLVHYLKEQGQSAITVYAGNRFEKTDRFTFFLDPSQKEDFNRLWREVPPPLEGLPGGIIHLWSLDGTPIEATTSESLRQDQVMSCESALYLAQSLVELQSKQNTRLLLVTRGSQAIGAKDQPLFPTQAPIWGLGRVLSLEHPELGISLIDLDMAAEEDLSVSHIGREIL